MMTDEIVIDEDDEAWYDTDTDCEACSGPCRIKPTWHACRIGDMLHVGPWSEDDAEWRFPIGSVLHIELREGSIPGPRNLGGTPPKTPSEVYLHTHYGVHLVHTCADMEHATTLRDELLTLIGWKEID